MDAIRGRADPNTQRGEMKLIDENGEQWETIDGKDFNSFIIRKVKKPINPMPELRPGMIVRRREFNSGQVNREEAAFTLGYYYGVSALQPDYDHSLAIWRQLEDRHAALKRALNYLKHGY